MLGLREAAAPLLGEWEHGTHPVVPGATFSPRHQACQKVASGSPRHPDTQEGGVSC